MTRKRCFINNTAQPGIQMKFTRTITITTIKRQIVQAGTAAPEPVDPCQVLDEPSQEAVLPKISDVPAPGKAEDEE